ncbi:hypothetical protein OOZ15_09030 [Galbibacter sp. EGI 63066]|uniref:hypothetical protein n=1 Tax=Galbibacter sp. EGI 63066 TaxID=2993559 RepID=UPI002248DD26|nr:hypothetical protein [Galbibacter sp. EGI 63066]MCX2680079.1 hypothetical protein [Galbibacter sp. EGI 63066]
MKKTKKLTFGVIIVIAIGIITAITVTQRGKWATTEVLDGYDSEAAAKETPVESFKDADVPKQKAQAGVNPPHGQPGHRCDIAVGAPLGSSTNNTPLEANATLNPAHGQPGHRCDIPVGAALPN